jgi:L-amino acid N-acyltransferase YncA
MAQASIRPAEPADLDAVAAIFGHYVINSLATFEEVPPTVAHWRRVRAELTGRQLPFLVATCADGVAGYAYAAPWRTKPAYRHTVEDTVYVAQGQTGRGIGRRLLNAVLDRCADVGVEQAIAVIADSGDPASIALHRACGFVEAGRLRRVGHKHGRRVDTVLLQRSLTAGDGETP